MNKCIKKRLGLAIGLIATLTVTGFPSGTPFPAGRDTLGKAEKRGSVFITPFYQFTHFSNLQLISHTNHYFLQEGETTYNFLPEEILEYNEHFGTAYNSSMTGVKIGYQVPGGLGFSMYAGVNHFYFQSWISREGDQKATTDYPALTLGVAADYQIKITDRIGAMAILSYNYFATKSMLTENLSGETVLSSHVTTMYYELNGGITYRPGKLVPYAGVGYSSQYLHLISREQIATEDGDGLPFNNVTEFDSLVRGGALYAFAGIEYVFNKKLTAYIRAAFPNPMRATYGIRVII
jgi:hypothetical protein